MAAGVRGVLRGEAALARRAAGRGADAFDTRAVAAPRTLGRHGVVAEQEPPHEPAGV